MGRSLILPEAEREVEDLFVRYLDYGDRAAARFVDAVRAALDRLEDHPYSGTPRPDLREGVRVAHLNPYRTGIFYTVVGGEDAEGDDVGDDGPVVVVLHVFRQERDVGGGDFE